MTLGTVHIAVFKKLSNKREIFDKSGKTKVEVIVMMLHNEARNLLVQAFEKNHNAKQVAEDFQVSVSTVYHLAEKIRKSGFVDLRTHWDSLHGSCCCVLCYLHH